MMRKWLAGKLFNLVVRLDWDWLVFRSMAVLIVEAEARARLAPKKKRGRPAGRKDSVAGVPVKKKIGRPLGSKDKSPRNKANMGRPKGSNSKPKVQP